MNLQLQAFQDFLATQSIQVPIWGFILNLVLAAVLAVILGEVYVRYGEAMSNRRQFARNFILLSMTTTLVIMIVKSSLALSLGLVGALSIVRFRAAIKDPEELTYLFMNIAIGLGLGAQQRAVTLAGFIIMILAIILRSRSRREESPNLLLTVSSHGKEKPALEALTELLRAHTQAAVLKRFDESPDSLEAAFLIECRDLAQLNTLRTQLQNLHHSLQISFLDHKGLA